MLATGSVPSGASILFLDSSKGPRIVGGHSRHYGGRGQIGNLIVLSSPTRLKVYQVHVPPHCSFGAQRTQPIVAALILTDLGRTSVSALIVASRRGNLAGLTRTARLALASSSGLSFGSVGAGSSISHSLYHTHVPILVFSNGSPHACGVHGGLGFVLS